MDILYCHPWGHSHGQYSNRICNSNNIAILISQIDAFQVKSYYRPAQILMFLCLQNSGCQAKFLLALISHEMKYGLAFAAGKVFILHH